MKKVLLFILIVISVSCKKDDIEDNDPVLVEECIKPINIQSDAVTLNSAMLLWESVNNSVSYTIEYGLSGFALGSGTTVNTTMTNLLLTDLDNNTTYDVYIQSVCSPTNSSVQSDAVSFTTLAPAVVPQFLPTLSELNIYSNALQDLIPNPNAFEYDLATPLFSDYSSKKRIIALPIGTSMDFVDDGLPNFPDNTLIAKTFFYNIDDRDESLGKTIIETRLLIKINGEWEYGNYKWNDTQTEAFLTEESSVVPIDYTDTNGTVQNVNYEIPSKLDCASCHNISDTQRPIGPKIRTLNSSNQLQRLIDANYLQGLTDIASVSKLPVWSDDNSFTIEERARAYMDIQCAHCHSDGGTSENRSELRLAYETPLADSFILERRASILERCEFYTKGFSMPKVGTTMIHIEGFDLMETYINSL